MTVKVMAGEAAVQTDAADVCKAVTNEQDVGERADFSGLYIAKENVHNAARATYRRRARGNFGDVLFVQLILSVLLAGGLWSGVTFGGSEVKEICASIIALFG